MHMKKLTLACLAATLGLSACGGGGSEPAGSTVVSRDINATDTRIACIDHNHNWRCDDGDLSQSVTSAGNTGLNPASDEFVLLERLDAARQRTLLLLSERGSGTVDGISTLKAMLGERYDTFSPSESFNSSDLEALFERALQLYPHALTALATASEAVLQQSTVNATLPEVTPTLGEPELVSNWAAESDNDNRQLTAYGSTVLSNTESNRLYLFDAAAASVAASEIDLLPAVELALNIPSEGTLSSWATQTSQKLIMQKLVEPALRMMASALSIVIDTASAASSITGQPSGEAPVIFEAGTGITSLQLVNNASEAFILVNTADDNFAGNDCATKGNEGLYKVALDHDGGYRLLADSTSCIYSGFSLLAADRNGAHVVAWDGTQQKLWLLDGSLKRQAQIATGVSQAQALAISPGGQFAAIAAYGQLAIVDLLQGKTIVNLAGDWANATQVNFAAGLQQIMVSSGNSLHTITLDARMQRLDSRITAFDSDILALATADDGESAAVATAKNLAWINSHSGETLSSQSTPARFTPQKIAITNTQLLMVGQQHSDDTIALMRLALSLPEWPH